MAYASWSVVFGEQPSAAKWNILGTNDASFNDGTGIAASAITPEKLFTGTGTTYAFSSWVPTWVNLSGGATTYAKYVQIGKTVFYRILYTLGGAGVAGSVTFTLPVTANSNYTVARSMIGQCHFNDTGTGSAPGNVRLETTGTGLLLAQGSAATYVTNELLSSTVPFTWANTDVIGIQGFYEAA